MGGVFEGGTAGRDLLPPEVFFASPDCALPMLRARVVGTLWLAFSKLESKSIFQIASFSPRTLRGANRHLT